MPLGVGRMASAPMDRWRTAGRGCSPCLLVDVLLGAGCCGFMMDAAPRRGCGGSGRCRPRSGQRSREDSAARERALTAPAAAAKEEQLAQHDEPTVSEDRVKARRPLPAQRSRAEGSGERPVLSASNHRGLRRGASYRLSESGPSGPASGRCVGEVPPRGREAQRGVPGGRPPGPARHRKTWCGGGGSDVFLRRAY